VLTHSLWSHWYDTHLALTLRLEAVLSQSLLPAGQVVLYNSIYYNRTTWPAPHRHTTQQSRRHIQCRSPQPPTTLQNSLRRPTGYYSPRSGHAIRPGRPDCQCTFTTAARPCRTQRTTTDISTSSFMRSIHRRDCHIKSTSTSSAPRTFNVSHYLLSPNTDSHNHPNYTYSCNTSATYKTVTFWIITFATLRGCSVLTAICMSVWWCLLMLYT